MSAYWLKLVVPESSLFSHEKYSAVIVHMQFTGFLLHRDHYLHFWSNIFGYIEDISGNKQASAVH